MVSERHTSEVLWAADALEVVPNGTRIRVLTTACPSLHGMAGTVWWYDEKGGFYHIQIDGEHQRRPFNRDEFEVMEDFI